jgi:hypothetical protein
MKLKRYRIGCHVLIYEGFYHDHLLRTQHFLSHINYFSEVYFKLTIIDLNAQVYCNFLNDHKLYLLTGDIIRKNC